MATTSNKAQQIHDTKIKIWKKMKDNTHKKKRESELWFTIQIKVLLFFYL
jgi:hypothetical protein